VRAGGRPREEAGRLTPGCVGAPPRWLAGARRGSTGMNRGDLGTAPGQGTGRAAGGRPRTEAQRPRLGHASEKHARALRRRGPALGRQASTGSARDGRRPPRRLYRSGHRYNGRREDEGAAYLVTAAR
jgi:hypothetical protein